jgi:hypothetical protein
MLKAVVILAFLQVYVFGQLGFVAIPIGFVILLYAKQHSLRVLDLMYFAAIYGFMISLFMNPNDAILFTIAPLLATAATLLPLRVLQHSRMRNLIWPFEPIFVSVPFTVVYWLTLASPGIQNISPRAVVVFIGVSASISIGLSYIFLLRYKEVR